MSGLVSALAGHIESVLEVKHALGLPYTSSERHLYAFNAFCAAQYPGQASISREMAMGWAASRPGEHVNGQMRRITPIRQLAKHMTGLGLDAYVIPAGIPGRQIRYRPHIYSHAQLRALFTAADQIVASPYGGARHLIIPVISCLGLRPGEARLLHRGDVDLDHGTVHIRESKGHKDRLLFLSADVHDYCRACDATISASQTRRVASFPNSDGGVYSRATIDYWFAQLRAAADPPIVAAAGSPPRVYDLRHAHVIEVINRWARQGLDPQAMVMYLSMHLGHANPEDTWYYFHLAADFHPDLRALANTSLEPLLVEPTHVL